MGLCGHREDMKPWGHHGAVWTQKGHEAMGPPRQDEAMGPPRGCMDNPRLWGHPGPTPGQDPPPNAAQGTSRTQVPAAPPLHPDVPGPRPHGVPTLARSASRALWPSKKTVSEGVLGFLEMLMSSFRRGTPRVTFLAETPA